MTAEVAQRKANEIASDKILALQAALISLPTHFHHTIETMHHFLPGIYVRTVLMKAGDIIVGKTHKLDHIAIISSGQARVVTNANDKAESITAPLVMKVAGGTKRALYIEEDMVWTTVHPNPSNTEDLAQLEFELIIPEGL